MKSPLMDPYIRFSDVQCTPLIYAAKQKSDSRVDFVRVLLQAPNIDVNALDRNGRSALTYACFYGDYDLVKTLLDSNASQSLKNVDSNYISPLVFAKRYNHTLVVTLLIQYGAEDIDISPSPMIKSQSVKVTDKRRSRKKKTLKNL